VMGARSGLVSGVRGANWANGAVGCVMAMPWVEGGCQTGFGAMKAMIPGLEPNEYSKNALLFE